MLKRLDNPVAALVVVVLIFCLCAWALPALPAANEVSAKSAYHVTNYYSPLAFFGDSFNVFWMWVTKDSISFFTFVLAVVSGGQGFLIFKQISLARDEFNATHRPKLHVRSMLHFIPEANKVAETTILVTNVGDTPATVVRVEADVGRRDEDRDWIEGFDLEECPLPQNLVIHPGALTGIDICSNGALSGISIAATSIDPNYPTLRFLGEISYIDGRGIERHTGFHFYWNSRTERWSRAAADDEQYED